MLNRFVATVTSRAVRLVPIAALFVLASGCDESESGSSPAARNSSEQKTSAEHTPRDRGAEGTVLARANGLTVTMEDYERFLRRSRLFVPSGRADGRGLSEARKSDRRFQSRAVRSLLEMRVVARAAEERGVTVEPGEIEQYVRGHEKLGHWADVLDRDAGEKVELPEGISPSDVRATAQSMLLREKLRSRLVEEPSDDELWSIYRRRHTKVRIAYLSIDNTPEPETIDEFVATHSGGDTSRIRRHFEQNASRYRLPKLVELSMVRPAPGESADREKLERAAKRLGNDESPAEVAEELGLEAETSAYLRREENREAFGAERGAAGFQMDGPRGAYAWRVEGWREGELPELDWAKRREVAADLLRQSIVPSAGEKAEEILGRMREVAREASWPIESRRLRALRDALSETGPELETTKLFAQNERGNVPGLGLAKPVMETAFELTSEAPVAEEPVLTRGRVVPVMLLERDGASRERFDEQIESFRDEVVRRRRERAVRDYLEDWFERHEPEIDLEPVREKYGRGKKKR